MITHAHVRSDQKFVKVENASLKVKRIKKHFTSWNTNTYSEKKYSTTIGCFDDTMNKNIHQECIYLNQICVKELVDTCTDG